MEKPQRHMPRLIELWRYGGHGMPPIASHARRLQRGFNHVAVWRRKMVFSRAWSFFRTGESSSSEYVGARGRFRTGVHAGFLAFRVGIGAADTLPSSSAQPRIYFRIREPGGSWTDVPAIRYRGPDDEIGETIRPSEVHWGFRLQSVSAETTYEWEMREVDNARPISVLITEFPPASLSAGDGHVTADGPTNDGPIYDELVSQLVAANNALPEHNAQHLIAWTRGISDSLWTVNSATENFIDQSTTVDSDSAGFVLDLSRWGSKNRKIKCVFAAHAGLDLATGSESNKVQLRDSSGVVAEVGPFGASAEWLATEVELDAAEHKLDMYGHEPDGRDMAINAVSLYPGIEPP